MAYTIAHKEDAHYDQLGQKWITHKLGWLRMTWEDSNPATAALIHIKDHVLMRAFDPLASSTFNAGEVWPELVVAWFHPLNDSALARRKGKK